MFKAGLEAGAEFLPPPPDPNIWIIFVLFELKGNELSLSANIQTKTGTNTRFCQPPAPPRGDPSIPGKAGMFVGNELSSMCSRQGPVSHTKIPGKNNKSAAEAKKIPKPTQKTMELFRKDPPDSSIPARSIPIPAPNGW